MTMTDEDGQAQNEDKLKKSASCSLLASKIPSSRHEIGDDNNNDGADNKSNKKVKELEASSQVSLNESWNIQELSSQTVKRRHVQSRRMQEYQQQLIRQPSRKSRICPVCGRTLFSGPGFRYHQQRHRRDNQSFPCDNCRKVFKSFNGLKYHLKRKRCRGQSHTVSSSSVVGTLHATTSSCDGRLMELAKIATGPQSPLLRSPGSEGHSSVTGAFFDDCEKSAAMTLSSMKQKCSSSAGTRVSNSHRNIEKPKRPMNGFMLFAQRNRTELNKKYPDMNNRMISTKLSEEWKNLSEVERKKWVDEAKEKAKRHQKEHPDCWKRKK